MHVNRQREIIEDILDPYIRCNMHHYAIINCSVTGEHSFNICSIYRCYSFDSNLLYDRSVIPKISVAYQYSDLLSVK